jgi:small-conductance mechanosensitive channel
MGNFFDPDNLGTLFEQLQAWAVEHVFNLTSLVQLVTITALFFIARYLARQIGLRLSTRTDKLGKMYETRPILVSIMAPGLWLILQGIAMAGFFAIAHNIEVVYLSVRLAAAWLIIHLMVSPLRNKFMARLLATFVWLIAALSILGLLQQTTALLEGASFSVGDGKQLTALAVVHGLTVMVMAIWVAVLLANLIEGRVTQVAEIDPSARVLIVKISRIVLITVGAVIGLTAAGIDLTIFAVVGGAIGLGIGFGLQKVVSNLFSGFILLVDRSIKPGDVIEIQGTYGSINRLAARYTSIITRDGTEFLVPNEDMITQPVVNWSHTNQLIRIHVGIGISYDSDVYKAREIMVEAAAGTDRVLSSPAPVCHLMEFGDNSINLDLRFWIRDPQNGLANVSSAVRLEIWEQFRDAGISIPFPQRDIRIISDPVDDTADGPATL